MNKQSNAVFLNEDAEYTINNGSCCACFKPSSIIEFNTTLCIRCAKEWNHGNGVGLVELTRKYAELL